MTQKLGRGGLGGVVAMLLAGCGGTVDFQEGGGAGVGGVGAGGAGAEAGLGGTPSAAGTPASGGAGGYAPVGGVGGYTPAGGSPGVPAPTEGVLAYDSNADGLGRAVYVTSFANPACRQRLTDPNAQAKQAAFSTDGAYLAYAAQVAGNYQVHVLDLASGDVEQVTTEPAGATSPAFSPDGDQIAFVTGDPEMGGNRAAGAGNLMLLDRATLDVTLVSNAETDLGCCTAQYLSPVFSGPDEILAGTRSSLLGLDLVTGERRDLVPITGRIPNPQDPSPSPDGIRYAFSDYCGSISLFIGRIDGSTGDTCDNAVPIGGASLISVDWGPTGYLAAEIKDAPRGVLLISEETFGVAPLAAPGARNPAWAPADADFPIVCD